MVDVLWIQTKSNQNTAYLKNIYDKYIIITFIIVIIINFQFYFQFFTYLLS